MNRPTLLALALVASIGCDKKPEPPAKPAAAPKADSAPATSATAAAKPPQKPATSKPAKMTWAKPDAWKNGTSRSSMRMATFVIPKQGSDSADAEMSVMQVGGSIPANISRWEGQFEGKPKAVIEKKKVNSLAVTIVSLEGTFMGGGPMMGGGAPQKDYALLAAIVDTDRGAHFFKMWGPKNTVKGSRPDFDKLVASFAPK